MELLASHIIDFLYSFKYFVLFVGVIIEGPILMVASGFLIRTGTFDVFPAFIAILAGDLVGDVIWYGVGYYFAGPILKKHGHFVNITPELFERSKELFHKYHAKILLISKVTIGFGMALVTLITAGATRVSFRKYMFLNLIGETILVIAMLVIGYCFGQVYLLISDKFKIFFIVFLVVIIILFIYKFTKYMKHKIAHI